VLASQVAPAPLGTHRGCRNSRARACPCARARRRNSRSGRRGSTRFGLPDLADDRAGVEGCRTLRRIRSSSTASVRERRRRPDAAQLAGSTWRRLESTNKHARSVPVPVDVCSCRHEERNEPAVLRSTGGGQRPHHEVVEHLVVGEQDVRRLLLEDARSVISDRAHRAVSLALAVSRCRAHGLAAKVRVAIDPRAMRSA